MQFQLTNTYASIVFATLLLCAYTTSTSENTTDSTLVGNIENFNCPEDCHCVIARNTHRPLLHAKCASLKGLASDEPLETTYPIHSIDLSYLGLTRLSHSLEKLHDITSIDLSHNELHEIGHLGRRIKKLNLKHNRFTSVKLTKLPQHVQVLNLQHNDITYLPLEFTKLMHLQTLELSHNQINCSCETLEVRNWLQDRHVFMESPVKCSYPIEISGKSWLQVKQSEICEKEKRGWYANEDENELMLGDQPVEGSADNDDEDELGNAYMPIDKTSNKSDSSSKSEELGDVEGSGDLSEMSMQLHDEVTTEGARSMPRYSQEENDTDKPIVEEDDNDDDDGSGSGAGIFMVPHVAIDLDDTDPIDLNENGNNVDDDLDNQPVEEPIHEPTPSPEIFGPGMGIFDTNDKNDEPVQEDIIVPVVHHDLGAGDAADTDVITDGPTEGIESEAIKRASVSDKDDSNATYFLLGVIGLIVVGLLLFVGIKRCKSSNAARDIENQRQTELLDMDKKNPGKPLNRNGNEHSPLIGEKSKSDMAKPINGANKKPYDGNDVKDGPGQQQPLIKGASNGTTPNESNADQEISKVNVPQNELAPHAYYPITPRYPTPKSPRASKYAQYPQQGAEPNNNNVDDAYKSPASPKLGRYSPVYSPETGRVKIKLTETPKPKTPMIVTRTKSNAGDIITTPVHLSSFNAKETPVGGANGHVESH